LFSREALLLVGGKVPLEHCTRSHNSFDCTDDLPQANECCDLIQCDKRTLSKQFLLFLRTELQPLSLFQLHFPLEFINPGGLKLLWLKFLLGIFEEQSSTATIVNSGVHNNPLPATGSTTRFCNKPKQPDTDAVNASDGMAQSCKVISLQDCAIPPEALIASVSNYFGLLHYRCKFLVPELLTTGPISWLCFPSQQSYPQVIEALASRVSRRFPTRIVFLITTKKMLLFQNSSVKQFMFPVAFWNKDVLQFKFFRCPLKNIGGNGYSLVLFDYKSGRYERFVSTPFITSRLVLEQHK